MSDLIYEIRGQIVMLDSDLAKLYEFKNGTKEINKLVKRHSIEFSKNCYFQLTESEYHNLKFPNGTSTFNHGGIRKLPHVFSLEGIEKLTFIIRRKNKNLVFENIRKSFETKQNTSITLNPRKLENIIYEIRNQQVMLDSDLARLYECKNGTKEINQAVKNNFDKFPERYSFILTDWESQNFLVKNFDQKLETRGGRFKNPRVFTEQGVYMLSTVLKSKVATKVNLAIMDTFALMRKYISNNLIEQKYINNLVFKHDEDIRILQESFKEFKNSENINTIFFDGQIYDAYSKLLDIMKKAKKELIIIDNYADKSILDIIRNLNTEIIIITKPKCLLKEIDIEKYSQEYHNLKIIYNNTFHDRYLILDKAIIYHCGTSLNYAGSRTFSVNKITDAKVIKLLINEIKTII